MADSWTRNQKLTLIGVVIAAITMVITALMLVDAYADAPAPDPPPVTTGVAIPPPDTTTPDTGTPDVPPPTTTTTVPPEEPTRPAGTVRWSGPVVVPGNQGLDLDAVPPRLGDSGADIVKVGFNDVDPGRGVTLAYSSAGPPGIDDCLSRFGQPGVPVLDAAEGSYVCVRTDQERVAVVEVLGIDADGYFTFEATVWD